LGQSLTQLFQEHGVKVPLNHHLREPEVEQH
jgi:hypothetical protein